MAVPPDTESVHILGLYVDLRERRSMVCASVWRDNPRALARGLSTVQAHKPCSVSLVS